MRNTKVIIVRALNNTPQDEVDKALEEIGDGWDVASAITTSEVFAIDLNSGQSPPFHHIWFTTTIVLKRGGTTTA